MKYLTLFAKACITVLSEALIHWVSKNLSKIWRSIVSTWGVIDRDFPDFSYFVLDNFQPGHTASCTGWFNICTLIYIIDSYKLFVRCCGNFCEGSRHTVQLKSSLLIAWLIAQLSHTLSHSLVHMQCMCECCTVSCIMYAACIVQVYIL